MTVLFDIRGMEWPVDADGMRLPPREMLVDINVSNAHDFLVWLGVPDQDLWGEIPARELAALLRRRLWPERRETGDKGRPGFVDVHPGRATLIESARPLGRLAGYAERLLLLAEKAGDGSIIWG